MQLTVRPIQSKEEWVNFHKTPAVLPFVQFQQSWEWGEFQGALGKKIVRVGIYNGEDLVATALLIDEATRFGSFIYSPRGPVCDYTDYQMTSAVLNSLVEYVAKTFDPVHFRSDPALLRGEKYDELYYANSFKDAVSFVQVERAWVAEIGHDSDEDLLKWLKANGMFSNRPWYLRKAEKSGVTVRISKDINEFKEIFMKMLEEMSKRKNAEMFPWSYYIEQFEHMSPEDVEMLFIAEYEGKPVSAAAVMVYGLEGSYVHGASYEIHRELSIPFYMQFEIMKHLRAKGLKRYNFWGIVSEKNMTPKNPRFGYSQFKLSFGGKKEEYMRTKDYVFKPLPYALFSLQERYRKIKYNID